MRPILCFMLLVGILGAGTGTARALDPNKLFNQALDLARGGQTDQAINLWLQVLVEVEDRYRPSVHRALGMGYAQLDKGPEAAYHLHAYLATRMAAESLKTRTRLENLENELRKNHRQITLACEPAGAQVEIHGVTYPCPLTWWFAPGKHQLPVRALGHKRSAFRFELHADSRQRLHQVSLEPVEPPGKRQRLEQIAFFQQVKQAARNGHASVVRRLALEHPEKFADLPCEYGWNAAIYSLTIGHCHDDLAHVLLDSRVQVCADRKHFEKVAELGCAPMVRAMLQRMPEEAVLKAAWNLSPTIGQHGDLDDVTGLLEVFEVLLQWSAAACESGPPDTPACQLLVELDDELGDLYESIATRLTLDDFVLALALRPAWSRKYQCRLLKKIAGDVQPGERCTQAARRIASFYSGGPTDCPLAHRLKHNVDLRCQPILEILLPDAVPEDAALAAMEYNDGDYLMPAVLPQESRVTPAEAIALGELLHKTNAHHCRTLGPNAENCTAARHVEEQIDRIRQAAKTVEQPQTVLDELCLVQGDLDELNRSLENERRLGQLSGAPNRAQLRSLAEKILPLEARLNLLRARHHELGGKAYKPTMCR